MVEITDEESARVWLEGKPREVQVAFAARCALRALPGIAIDTPETLSGLALPIQRAILTSAVAAVGSTADVKEAARSAAFSAARSAAYSAARSAAYSAARSAADSAAYSAARSAADSAASAAAAASAADSAYSAARSAARSAAYSAISSDAGALDTLADVSGVFQVDLWHGAGLSEGLAEALETLRAFWQAEPKVWGFWQRWYEGMLRGEPMDWELQRQVALIPNEDWEKGAAHIAKMIAVIEAEFDTDEEEEDAETLVRLLPQSERVVFNSETARFRLEPVEIANPGMLGATLSQVADALDDVLAEPRNGLHEGSREVRVLRRMQDRYGNDPQRIEMDCTSVHGALTRQIATEELPPSEENLALQQALGQVAQGIRATHPEIAENRRILTEQAFREMTDAERTVLEEAQPVLEAISEGVLAEDFAEDIPLLLSPEMRLGPPAVGGVERNPVLAGYNEQVRVFSRSAAILMALKASEASKNIVVQLEESTSVRAVALFLLLREIVKLGLGLFY